MNRSTPILVDEKMHPVDSVAAGRLRILVIQLGGELECMLTRGWIRTLQSTADVEIVSRLEYREVLDLLPNPTCYHPLSAGPVALLRLHKQLRRQQFDRVLCLHDNISSRWLANICPPDDRIHSNIGPPSLPEEIDAVLAVLFGRLGITLPHRKSRLVLSTDTARSADKILNEFGYSTQQKPVLIAPSSAADTDLLVNWHACNELENLPVLLLPAENEIELIDAIAGQAYLVPSPGYPLRAALISRAQKLISNDPVSRQLAELMHTPVTET